VGLSHPKALEMADENMAKRLVDPLALTALRLTIRMAMTKRVLEIRCDIILIWIKRIGYFDGA